MSPHGAPSDEVAALRAQLQQARQALEDFSHTVSHDLRAPLRHVRAFIGIAREDLGDAASPEVQGHLRTAADAAEQMGRMLDVLLGLSRLAGHAMEPVDIDVLPLVEEVRDRVEAASTAANPARWHIAGDCPRVRADPFVVGELLWRLLDNARKFSRHANPPDIAVGWRPGKPGWCEFHVRDNGAGFDPRFTDRLFQVFQRLHGARDFEGLGGGLAYVRLAVARHGGAVGIRGDLGPGCEVRFSLPLAGASAQ